MRYSYTKTALVIGGVGILLRAGFGEFRHPAEAIPMVIAALLIGLLMDWVAERKHRARNRR